MLLRTYVILVSLPLDMTEEERSLTDLNITVARWNSSRLAGERSSCLVP